MERTCRLARRGASAASMAARKRGSVAESRALLKTRTNEEPVTWGSSACISAAPRPASVGFVLGAPGVPPAVSAPTVAANSRMESKRVAQRKRWTMCPHTANMRVLLVVY